MNFSFILSHFNFRVLANVTQCSVDGVEQDGAIPKLVIGNLEDREHLLFFLFEKNPLDRNCGQYIQFTSKPLSLIYDAVTINSAMEIFKTPPSSALEQYVCPNEL